MSAQVEKGSLVAAPAADGDELCGHSDGGEDEELCAVDDKPFAGVNVLGPQKLVVLIPLAMGWRVVGWCELVVCGDCTAVACPCCNNKDYPDCRNMLVWCLWWGVSVVLLFSRSVACYAHLLCACFFCFSRLCWVALQADGRWSGAVPARRPRSGRRQV